MNWNGATKVVQLGILGGTFDPPHVGHLILAACAADALTLTRILFVPAADPPHKQGQPVTSAAHRLMMVQLAIEDNPSFALSRVDIDRSGPHFTVDMLALLHLQYPSAELFFLMGSDSLRDFPTWRNPAGILEQASLAVMQRPTVTYDLNALALQVPSIRQRVHFIDTPLIDIAGSDIRRRRQRGFTLRYMLPSAVEHYILEHGLYLDPPADS